MTTAKVSAKDALSPDGTRDVPIVIPGPLNDYAVEVNLQNFILAAAWLWRISAAAEKV